MIQFKCPHCAKAFRVDDSYAGKQTKCAGCGQRITVPPLPPPLPTVQAIPVPNQDTKACPFCREQILAVARKCRHCGEILDVTLRGTQETQRPAACRYCSGELVPKSKMSTAGIIMLLAGLLLAPVVVGLILILLSFSMKEKYLVCCNCGVRA